MLSMLIERPSFHMTKFKQLNQVETESMINWQNCSVTEEKDLNSSSSLSEIQVFKIAVIAL